MTTEEKAKELLNKFSSLNQWIGGEGNISLGAKMGKQCAITCVDEVLKISQKIDIICNSKIEDGWSTSEELHWREVKKHLESM